VGISFHIMEGMIVMKTEYWPDVTEKKSSGILLLAAPKLIERRLVSPV
jgi:hypothetical protein